jgi:hypothetical protein
LRGKNAGVLFEKCKFGGGKSFFNLCFNESSKRAANIESVW